MQHWLEDQAHHDAEQLSFPCEPVHFAPDPWMPKPCDEAPPPAHVDVLEPLMDGHPSIRCAPECCRDSAEVGEHRVDRREVRDAVGDLVPGRWETWPWRWLRWETWRCLPSDAAAGG